MQLPHLTRAFNGVGGSIKNRPEDFFVQEIPLYEPSGEGEHVYCEIQKIGMTTFEVIDRFARGLRVSTRDIGYAGMKDAQAVTRQTLSIPGVTEEQVFALEIPNVQIHSAIRHGNKLRLGHLAGNRFAIKIRDVVATDVIKLEPVLAEIVHRGMPNYFGEQRFGRRGDNDRLGAAIVRGDEEGLLKLLLGTPKPELDDSREIESRTLFDRGDYPAAMNAMPRRNRMEAIVLARLMKTGKPEAAVAAIEERISRLWISSLQSRLFNEVVARRIDGLDRLLDGDLAWKHDSGAVFLVESAAAEQARSDAFEVSPSGPLVGYRMTEAAGKSAEVEAEVFAAAGLKPQDFRRAGDLKVKGARRPLRVQPGEARLDAGGDQYGPYIAAAFTLPPGSFATVLLSELMKTMPSSEHETVPAAV